MITRTYRNASGKPFMMTMTGEGAELRDTQTYFNYIAAVRRILRFLNETYGREFGLYYQDDSDDVWDALEEDLNHGYEGVEHASGLFDLVEARTFSYVADPEPDRAGYNIRPSVSNNLFVYPRHLVAFARIPKLLQYGIGYENLIFAADDEGLTGFLTEMRSRQLADRQIVAFTDGKDGQKRSRESFASPVDRDDVFMDLSVKTQIFRMVDEFFQKDRAFYRTYNIPYRRGILLYGKPGNGKTTLVKSIAASVEAPVAYWQITEYTTSESIQEVFAAAARMAPMVLVIEDIDSLPECCRSFFLNTLDGATTKEGIFLIGTTNYPEKIDPALMNRAGRFDRAYEVKLPDEALRLAFLQRKGLDRLADADAAAAAARRTEGFTFAQLGELYVSAALQMHYEGRCDLERLMADMKSDYAKDRTGSWLTDSGPRRLGFVAGD